MHSILVTQAGQHPSVKKLVMKFGDKGYHENSMTDAFWPTASSGTARRSWPGVTARGSSVPARSRVARVDGGAAITLAYFGAVP